MMTKQKPKIYRIPAPRLYLKTLEPGDASAKYRGWLNDAEAQAYTRRRGRVSTLSDVKKFIAYTRESPDWHFALKLKKNGAHIGNISLNGLDEKNRSGEISIMIGDRMAWGQGYGEEAIKTLAAFAFKKVGLHRLWAESPNPAFNALMKKLGWTPEGARRAAFLLGDTFVDVATWSLLAEEWHNRLKATASVARRLALLMTAGSPVGLSYLEAMIAAGMPPALVILSTTKKLSALAIRTVRERTKNRFAWKPLSELTADHDIPVYFTASHNSDLTRALLKRHNIDFAILGGTGIIKAPTIAAARRGIINTHPGILPEYRGCNAVEWSLYNNDPVGASCHFVTPEIDAGDIIATKVADIWRGDDYSTVRLKAYELQAEVLLKGLKALGRPDYEQRLIPNAGGHYYPVIGEGELKIAQARLRAKTYRHYAKRKRSAV